MKAIAVRFLLLLLTACAGAPPMPTAVTLFHDELFSTPAEPIHADAALTLSPAMRDYLAALSGGGSYGSAERRKRLLDALVHGDLRLAYDASRTRSAAQTFEARSGNCLALVLMTAAFAKASGLTVHYQLLTAADGWDRSDDLFIAVGHINLRLDLPSTGPGSTFGGTVVVDFLPPADAARLPTRDIDERSVVAMYSNNRAVESLREGRLDDAYWFARESLRTDPEWLAGYLTLGVVYRARGRPDLAEQALARVAAREPDNLAALANRIPVLRELGRATAADVLAGRLAALDPHPPFSYFNDGMAALRDGRFEAARRFLAQEVARAPYRPEFEYWLGIACLRLDDEAGARLHLARAIAASTSGIEHDLYAAKLGRLEALHRPSK